jgi:hypothetical protein
MHPTLASPFKGEQFEINNSDTIPEAAGQIYRLQPPAWNTRAYHIYPLYQLIFST